MRWKTDSPLRRAGLAALEIPAPTRTRPLHALLLTPGSAPSAVPPTGWRGRAPRYSQRSGITPAEALSRHEASPCSNVGPPVYLIGLGIIDASRSGSSSLRTRYMPVLTSSELSEMPDESRKAVVCWGNGSCGRERCRRLRHVAGIRCDACVPAAYRHPFGAVHAWREAEARAHRRIQRVRRCAGELPPRANGSVVRDARTPCRIGVARDAARGTTASGGCARGYVPRAAADGGIRRSGGGSTCCAGDRPDRSGRDPDGTRSRAGDIPHTGLQLHQHGEAAYRRTG